MTTRKDVWDKRKQIWKNYWKRNTFVQNVGQSQYNSGLRRLQAKFQYNFSLYLNAQIEVKETGV